MMKHVLGAIVVSTVCVMGCAVDKDVSGGTPLPTEDGLEVKANSIPGSGWTIRAHVPQWTSQTVTVTGSVNIQQGSARCSPDCTGSAPEAFGGATLLIDRGIPCSYDNDPACGTALGYKYCIAQDGYANKTCHIGVGNAVRGKQFAPSDGVNGLSHNFSNSFCGSFRTMGVYSNVPGACASEAGQQDPWSCARSVSAALYWCGPQTIMGTGGGESGEGGYSLDGDDVIY